MCAPRRVLATGIAVLAALLAAATLGVSPAAAHAVLTGTQPERGATVTDTLEGVTLQFSEPVAFPQVQVTGPDDERVEEGLPLEGGDSVVQPLAPLSEHGMYRVVFRVTSDDGHPIEGETGFVYAGPIMTGQTGTPPGDRGEPVTGENEGTEDDREVPADRGEDVAPEEAGHEAGGVGTPVLVVALLAVLAFAGAALLAVRRRAGGSPPGGPPSGEHGSSEMVA